MWYEWKELELPRCIICGSTATGNMLEVFPNKITESAGHLCINCVKDIVTAYDGKYRVGGETVAPIPHEAPHYTPAGPVIDTRVSGKRTRLDFFNDTFAALAAENYSGDVFAETLIKALQKEMPFVDARDMIEQELHRGEIYERRTGVYARTD